jgi:glycosyltransferase involved in cell wall biosynthesis
LGIQESRIKVLYSGVDHALYRPGLKFEHPTILWIGRMKKYKNLDHVVRAFKIVKASVGNARLILAGDGEEQSRVRVLAAQEKLDSDIVFAGSVSVDSKVRLLQGAWSTVYASMVEGWGIGVIEAAACGTPTVAYGTGGLKEAIIDGTTGYLTKYGAADELAQKLERVLTDENLRRRLGENALMRSYDFNWDRTTTEAEQFLGTLL